ncbi:MAG: hypothetical protein NWE83_07920 [Candidatus Bathyarchaeota archaeon]|nr:hypothetical protein [Candidatus Bathyarchaeota archaeon]
MTRIQTASTLIVARMVVIDIINSEFCTKTREVTELASFIEGS